MIKIIKSVSEIKNKDIFIYLEKKKDIQDFQRTFKLDKKIIEKIESLFEDDKDNFFSFYVGSEIIDSLYILVSSKKHMRDTRQNTIGKYLSKLPNIFTVYVAEGLSYRDVVDTCILGKYSFQDFKKEKEKFSICIFSQNDIVRKNIKKRLSTLENIKLARDFGEMPSNILTPEEFASQVKNTKFKTIKTTVLGGKQIEKKKLGLLHAVGKGSVNQPHIVILEKIVDKKLPTVGIVGKGITFDTGGIQVKPDTFMYEMKGDMGGAAVVFSIMKELDSQKLPFNIVACLCLAENSISSTSYKPSDVITGYTGKTVEVIHTDAEGRLVLADGISYISKNYKTSKMITVATLTGACMVALGYRYAGIMGTDKNLINEFINYSQNNPEKYFELPFDDFLLEKTKSQIADFKNLDRSVHAGSSMGGAFLYNFLENNEDFVHIDIAGAYLNGGDTYGKVNKGATGFGVESISEILSGTQL